MYILNPGADMIINSEFVERFLIVNKPDASLVIASYSDSRPPVTLGRYKADECAEVFGALYAELVSGGDGFIMPPSALNFGEVVKKDARTKRKGGS